MKFDVHNLKYLSSDDFRVLTAVEMGMKNHELVPTPLIERIAALRRGGAKKVLGNLLKHKLIHHEAKRYDGYNLVYAGYDYLALKAFAKRGFIYGVGRQIGVGKESDIYIVINDDDEEMVLKLQRLGRQSFRAIKSKRDYLQHRQSASWLYLSRLAALKEFAFMKALHEVGFPVPRPVDWNRHCVLMELIDGAPLYQVREMTDPEAAFRQCIDLIVRFAEHGLIHGDFNEFNLLVREEDEKIIVIDFPQMVSTSHANAEMYFDRDIECIHVFFARRFGLASEYRPKLVDVIKRTDLDVQVAASGFSKDHQLVFEQLQREQGDNVEGEANDSDEEEQSEEGEDDSEEEEEDTAPQQTTPAISAEILDKVLGEQSNLDDDGNNEASTAANDDEEDDGDADTASQYSTNSKARSSRSTASSSSSTLDRERIAKQVKQKLSKEGTNVFKAAKRNAMKGKDKFKMRTAVNDKSNYY